MKTPWLIVVPLIIGLLGTSADAAPPPVATLTFPGCAPTLQGCIDAAPDGALVEIATDGPIAEDLDIERSLQLRAAPGFHPVFAPFSGIFATPPAAGGHLVIRGLTWEPAGSSGEVHVVHSSAGAFEVEILDNAFLGITGATSGRLVFVRTATPSGSTPLGPLTLTVARNRFEIPAGAETTPLGLSLTERLDGTVRIEGNTVHTADETQAGALSIYHTEGALDLDVVHNVIESGNADESGIEVRQTGDGTGLTTATIAGNLITGIGDRMRFGVELYASDGTIDLAVVHNTIAHASWRAVQVGGREDLGGDATGIIANNVLAFSTRSDVGIHEFADTVIERRNLLTFIDPTDAPAAPGPESIVVSDPGFAGSGDFRLTPTSPGVNTADPTLLPALLALDLDGRPRVAGPAPDMGAYELPCAPDGTEPHCTTPPSCELTGCPTDDPCAPAACMNDQCLPAPATGIESARCACDRPLPAACGTVPFSIVRRQARACELLERAAASTNGRKVPRLLSNARRTWDRAAWQTGRRALGGIITPACATALQDLFADAEARVELLLQL